MGQTVTTVKMCMKVEAKNCLLGLLFNNEKTKQIYFIMHTSRTTNKVCELHK